MAIGAYMGGVIMRWSRRYCVIIASALGMVGAAATLIINIWSLYLGRVIYGVSAGMLSVSISRYQ